MNATLVTRHFHCNLDIFESSALYVEGNPGIIPQIRTITTKVFGPMCLPA